MSEEDRKKYKDCRRFTQVSVYEGTVEVLNTTNPGGGSVQVPAGHKTWVVCGFAPFPPSEIAAAVTAAGAELPRLAAVSPVCCSAALSWPAARSADWPQAGYSVAATVTGNHKQTKSPNE